MWWSETHCILKIMSRTTVSRSCSKKNIKKINNEKIRVIKRNQMEIMYFPEFLDMNTAKELYSILKHEIPWAQGSYKMFGKPVIAPRLLWAMGDNVNGKYIVTGFTMWSNVVRALKELIEKAFDVTLSYAQLNYYRNGEDYIGWHRDKEVEEGDSIYSISLGVTRRFILRNNDYKTSPIKYEFHLLPGSLIVLNRYAANIGYKHTVPKEKRITHGRINITFRNK